MIGTIERCTMHPNGFIQYPLNDGARLHIWSPLLPEAQKVKTPIHDHTFDFMSIIIMGKLEHITYCETAHKLAFGDDAVLDTTHLLWGAADVLQPTASAVGLEEADHLFLASGSRYTLQAGKFHESRGHGLTATIMTKTALFATPWAYVAIPHGVEPDNTFRRDQYSHDYLFEFVQRLNMELFNTTEVNPANYLNLRDSWRY